MNIKVPIKKRLERHHELDPLSGCWLWTAYKDKDGYGSTSMDQKVIRAHRASYIVYIGTIPEGMLVCHKCDNPSCINPEHLFLGTITDNNRDKYPKGRAVHYRGLKHHNCKLSDSDVRKIRKDTRKQKHIAKDYGVSFQHISAIKLGKFRIHV